MALFVILVLVGGWYIITFEVPDEAKRLAKDYESFKNYFHGIWTMICDSVVGILNIPAHFSSGAKVETQGHAELTPVPASTPAPAAPAHGK